MLIAIDIAILPPPAIAARAIDVSAALPANEYQGLRLGGSALPHITLTQQFVPADALAEVTERISASLAGVAPLDLAVVGSGRGESSVWMTIARTPALADLHRSLMDALEPYERVDGTVDSFMGGARTRDVEWVAGFRTQSSYAAFTPHITLGHAARPPAAEPMDFIATTVALCHLGRFCTCARVIRQWELHVGTAGHVTSTGGSRRS